MGIAKRADGMIRGRYQTNIAATNIEAAQTSDALRFGIDDPRSARGRIAPRSISRAPGARLKNTHVIQSDE